MLVVYLRTFCHYRGHGPQWCGDRYLFVRTVNVVNRVFPARVVLKSILKVPQPHLTLFDDLGPVLRPNADVVPGL
jgi:hypothetical protein